MHKCITTWIDSSPPDLFTTSQSPSLIDLCLFKVTVLTPLQWWHQTLSSFGFLTDPHSSRMCSPLSLWPKSNNIMAFVQSKVCIWGRTWNVWSSKHGWPRLGWCSQVRSIYLRMIRFHSSLWLSKIPLCINTTFS
jgi:hypothetical protein